MRPSADAGDGREPTDAGSCPGTGPACFSGALGGFCGTAPVASECRAGLWTCPEGTLFRDECAPCVALDGCVMPTGLLRAVYVGTLADDACRPELQSLELLQRSGTVCLRTTSGALARRLAVSSTCELSWGRSWGGADRQTEEEAKVRPVDGGLSGTWSKRVLDVASCEARAQLLLLPDDDGGVRPHDGGGVPHDGGVSPDAGAADAGSCAARTLVGREGALRVDGTDGGPVASSLDEEVNVLASGHSGSLRSIDVRSSIGVLRVTFAAPLAATELVRAGEQARLRLEWTEDTTLYRSPSQVLALSQEGRLVLFGGYRSSFALRLPEFPEGPMVGLAAPSCTSTQPDSAGCRYAWRDLTVSGPDLPFVSIPPGTQAVSGPWTVAVAEAYDAFGAARCDTKDTISFVAARLP